MDHALTSHLPGLCVATNDWCTVHIISFVFMHQSFVTPPTAQRNVKDFYFVSAVPHSNHHTVGAASWQNHDSSPPQSVFILHSNVCLCLSNPYISPALWRQRISKKTQHIISPSYSEAWVKQWLQMTGALFIAYDALRMNI